MNDGEGEGWGRSERGRLELMQLNGDVVEGEKGGRKEIEVCVRVCVCVGEGGRLSFFFFLFLPAATLCQGDECREERDSEHLLSLSDVASLYQTHTSRKHTYTCTHTHTHIQTHRNHCHAPLI